MEKKRSITIDYLKAFAMILVVLGHSMDYMAVHYQPFTTLEQQARMIIYAVHVPLFFMVAGYLTHKKESKAYIYQKIKRILIPFLFFTTLKLLYTNLISNAYRHGDSLWEQMKAGFGKGELYWFSYALFIMYMLIPLVWNNRKKCWVVFMVILGWDITNLLFGFLRITNYFQIRKTLLYIPFFLGGYLLSQYKEKISVFEKHHRLQLLAVSIVGTILIIAVFGKISFCLKYVVAVCLGYIVYCIASCIKKEHCWLQMIARYSYQIFLLDSFYKVVLFVVVSRFMPINIAVTLVLVILNIFLGCITCMIVEKIPVLRNCFGLGI